MFLHSEIFKLKCVNIKMCLFWIILSIRSEEDLLFLEFLIYIKTHNRMEINL